MKLVLIDSIFLEWIRDLIFKECILIYQLPTASKNANGYGDQTPVLVTFEWNSVYFKNRVFLKQKISRFSEQK